MPQTITKVRVSNCLLRNSARGLQSVYYCKLQRYCKERWERIASRQFLRGAKSMSRNNAQKLAQRYFSKLYYHRHLSPAKAARSGGSALQPADPSSGNFKVRVACDVYGMKKNIRLSFRRCPRLEDLVNCIESQFDALARSCRPAGFPDVPFFVQAVQVFDHKSERWVDLVDESQLNPGCQLFCFPPETSWHSDSQGVIPDAKEVYTWMTAEASPHRNRLTSVDRGLPPSSEEMARFVFFDMCRVGQDALTRSDLRAGFSKCDMVFDSDTEDAVVAHADSDRDGLVSLGEWLRFASDQPNIIDALYFRIKDLYSDGSSAIRSMGGHAHLHSIASYNDPRDPGYLLSSNRVLLADDLQNACRDAEAARIRLHDAELRESQARQRMRLAH